MAKKRAKPAETHPKNPLDEAIEGLRLVVSGEMPYSHDALARAYTGVTILADEGLAKTDMSPLEHVELKLAATKDARKAAFENNDFDFAANLAQTAATYEGIQTTLACPEAPVPPKPAATPASQTSAAKS